MNFSLFQTTKTYLTGKTVLSFSSIRRSEDIRIPIAIHFDHRACLPIGKEQMPDNTLPVSNSAGMASMGKYPILVMGLFGKFVEGSLKKIYFTHKKRPMKRNRPFSAYGHNCLRTFVLELRQPSCYHEKLT